MLDLYQSTKYKPQVRRNVHETSRRGQGDYSCRSEATIFTAPRQINPQQRCAIDVINDFEFDGGEELLRLALPAGRNIAALKRRAKDAGIPTIYVNDNFGRWQSDFKKIVAHCREESRGKALRRTPLTG